MDRNISNDLNRLSRYSSMDMYNSYENDVTFYLYLIIKQANSTYAINTGGLTRIKDFEQLVSRISEIVNKSNDYNGINLVNIFSRHFTGDSTSYKKLTSFEKPEYYVAIESNGYGYYLVKLCTRIGTCIKQASFYVGNHNNIHSYKEPSATNSNQSNRKKQLLLLT